MRRCLAAALTVLACAAASLSPLAPASADRRDPGRVYAGDDAAPGQVPGMAYVTDDQGSTACGGTLVSPTQVLTAAHCVFTGGNLLVVLGITDLADPEDVDTGEIHSVAAVEVHPAYQSGDFPYDLALLTLDAPSGLTPVRVVESDEDGLWLDGQVATVAGWA